MALFALTLALLLARRFGETRPPAAGPAARVAGWRQYLPIATSGRFVYFAVFGMAGMAMILVFVSAAPVVLVQRLGYSELGFAPGSAAMPCSTSSHSSSHPDSSRALAVWSCCAPA